MFPLLMIVGMGAVFYFAALRPAKKRQAAQAQLVNTIEVGDRVMTTAGMFGYVQSMGEEEIGLEISPGVVVQMLKPAIAKKVEEPASDSGDAADDPRTISLQSDALRGEDSGTDNVIDVSQHK